CAGDGEALLARGAVGDQAYWIDRLGGGAGGDEDVAAGQRLAAAASEGGRDGLEDRLRLRHAPGTELAAGHGPVLGPDEEDAVGLQGREVPLGGGVAPHAYVHRRRHQHRLVGGQQGGGGKVAGEAVRRLGHQVGGRGRDDHEVGRARELNVAHLGFVGQG